jgi:hypothetical protein
MPESLEQMAARCTSHHNSCACMALATSRQLQHGRRAIAHLRELVLAWTAVQQQPGNPAATQLLRTEMQHAIRLLDDLDSRYRTS